MTITAPKRFPTDVLNLVDEEVRDWRLRPRRGPALGHVEESAAILAGLTDTLTTLALGDGPNGMVPARSIYALAQVMEPHSKLVAGYLDALRQAAEKRPQRLAQMVERAPDTTHKSDQT